MKRRSKGPFREPKTPFWATLSFMSSIVDQRSRRYERLFAAISAMIVTNLIRLYPESARRPLLTPSTRVSNRTFSME